MNQKLTYLAFIVFLLFSAGASYAVVSFFAVPTLVQLSIYFFGLWLVVIGMNYYLSRK